jgi:hypothetical protein
MPAGVDASARVASFGNGGVDKVWRSSVGIIVMAESPLPSHNGVWKRPEMVRPSARSSWLASSNPYAETVGKNITRCARAR